MFHSWKYVEKQDVLKILLKLEALFKTEESWLFFPLAEDQYGVEVKPTDPTATKFSLMGASELFTTQLYQKPLADYIDCALREYLNDLSGDDLIRGKCEWRDELLLIKMGVEELSK